VQQQMERPWNTLYNSLVGNIRPVIPLKETGIGSRLKPEGNTSFCQPLQLTTLVWSFVATCSRKIREEKVGKWIDPKLNQWMFFSKKQTENQRDDMAGFTRS
jgi:hypothetical protein